MSSETTISESEVLRRLQDVTVYDKGRSNEQEREDGIYEMAWWDIPPEAAEELADLKRYENVSLQTKNSSQGPNMDTTVRVSVSTCIIPARPDEVMEAEWERYEEDREEYYRERHDTNK